MTHTPPAPNQLPRIQTPCPKRWEELVGGEKRRFCSECCLHVHNGAELTRAEAQSLIVNATERVCMRLELDPAGAPVFRDSQPAAAAPRRRSLSARAAGWAASAAAAVLAACARTTPPPPPQHPELDPATANSTDIMGKVARPEVMGDVAEPPRTPAAVRMGEATVAPVSTIPPTSQPTPDGAGPR